MARIDRPGTASDLIAQDDESRRSFASFPPPDPDTVRKLLAIFNRAAVRNAEEQNTQQHPPAA